MSARTVVPVLGVPIDAMSWETALTNILDWARGRESRYVAICNVHVVVTASANQGYMHVIDEADLATPDGAPIAWMLRRLGFREQRRISGPDLMWALCKRCALEHVPVFLYGSTESTLAGLEASLRRAFPQLLVAGTESPPFRDVTREEDANTVSRINASNAGVVFVGLGCPKQERWMAEHRGRVLAVMIGVGAAFEFHAGTLPRAPLWMQHHGLEWLHRLWLEPRRLWKRYLVTNLLFMIGAIRQLLLRR